MGHGPVGRRLKRSSARRSPRRPGPPGPRRHAAEWSSVPGVSGSRGPGGGRPRTGARPGTPGGAWCIPRGAWGRAQPGTLTSGPRSRWDAGETRVPWPGGGAARHRRGGLGDDRDIGGTQGVRQPRKVGVDHAAGSRSTQGPQCQFQDVDRLPRASSAAMGLNVEAPPRRPYTRGRSQAAQRGRCGASSGRTVGCRERRTP